MQINLIDSESLLRLVYSVMVKKNGKTIDAVMDNFVAWKEFCEANDLKATRHTGSAGDIAEKNNRKYWQIMC